MPTKADRDQYELLCTDNTRRPVDEYEQCHLARVPSHVVVARSVDGKEDSIQELLRVAQVPPPDILSSACSSLLQCVWVCAFRIQWVIPSRSTCYVFIPDSRTHKDHGTGITNPWLRSLRSTSCLISILFSF